MTAVALLWVVSAAASGCATASPEPSSAAPSPAPEAATAELRLLTLDPPAGSAIDSSSRIVATLAYHIPAFDPLREYVVTATFAGRGGGSFNRGGGEARITAPAGIVTLEQSLRAVLTDDPETAARPLTGSIFLLESQPGRVVREDTVRVDDRVRVRVLAGPSRVLARTPAFFYNGRGPSRSFGASLVDRLEEYWTFSPHKAIAFGFDPEGQWVYGYAYGYGSAAEASARALRHCRDAAEQRGLAAECRLAAVDDTPR